MIGKNFNNRYEIIKELGRGAMGTIYHAHDTLLDRDVALKVLSSSQLAADSRAKLLAEAKAAAKLNHPNIISIFDAGEVDHSPFIVMELVEGASLFQEKPSTLSEIYSVSHQICDALEHAHRNGIVHRDLKPENVIKARNGIVKLSDFGMAHSFSSRLSTEGAIIGTVYYIAPETVQGKAIDGRTDLYALGVMLYEWLTGTLPFNAEDPVAVISQHLYAPIVPPHTYNQEIPPGLESLIFRLLSKLPEDRPASAEEVGSALAALETMGAESYPSAEMYFLDRLARGRLVGRDQEMYEMRNLWQKTISGEGHVLLVSGEPGIGKTRIVRELMANAAVTGGRALMGECFAEGGMPYFPFAPMIRETVPGSGNARLHLHEYVIADLIKITPGLESAFPAVIPNLALDPMTEQQHILESLVAWCTALAEKSPVLLFFDDAHWADSATLQLIRHLAHRTRNLRVLIVLSYREIELSESTTLQSILQDLSRDRMSTRIKLTRFNYEETRELLSTLLIPAGKIDTTLAKAIFKETEGNPFYVEEVCKTLLEEGKLCLENGEWVSPVIDRIDIPQSVRLTIQSRLSRLPEETQNALKLGSIFGREFEFNLLLKAGDYSEVDLIDQLETAEQAQIIREIKADHAGPLSFAFEHALIPGSLRESLSGLRRQRMHRQVAAAIQELHPEDYETLAFHYEEAGDADQALANYRLAAKRALEVYANQEAERYYRNALELCRSDEGKAEILAGLGEAAFRNGKQKDAEKAFEEAIILFKSLKNYDAMARLFSLAARAAWYLDNAKSGLALCQRGMAEMPEGIENDGMAMLLHETARAYRFNDDFEKALEYCHQALAMAEKLSLPEVQADTYATIGIIENLPHEERRQALEKAVVIGQKHNLLMITARAQLNLASNYIQAGEFTRANESLKKSYEATKKFGIPYVEFFSLISLLDSHIDLALFDEAEALLPRLRELQKNNPNPLRAGYTISGEESMLLYFTGQIQEAINLLDNTMSEIPTDKDQDLVWRLTYLKMEILQTTGEFDKALDLGQGLLKNKLEEKPEILSDFYHILFTLTSRIGKQKEAKEFLEKALKLSEKDNSPMASSFKEAMLARWNAINGDFDSAIDQYGKVLPVMKSTGSSWRIARIQEELAEVLEKRGKPGDKDSARELLNQAQELYKTHKMPYLAEKIAKKLKSHGNTPIEKNQGEE